MMLTENKTNYQIQPNSRQPIQISTSGAENMQTSTRVSIRIPKKYRQEPVISRLIGDCGLTVNIKAALLGNRGYTGGWFDLELWGNTQQIRDGLIYLSELDPGVYLEIWHESTAQESIVPQNPDLKPFNSKKVGNNLVSKTEATTCIRIKIKVPAIYQQQPIISVLTSSCGLKVNITGAVLGVTSQREGVFDLEISGTPKQIQMALDYLHELDVKIWGKSNPDGDSW